MATPGSPVPLTCPETDTPGERRTALIVRRNAGVPNDRGGYTDDPQDVAAYCGFLTETRRRGEIAALTDQGLYEIPHRIWIVEEIPDLDVRINDQLIEAVDDGTGSGNVVPKPQGDLYMIFGVRHYDNSTQVDVKHILENV